MKSSQKNQKLVIFTALALILMVALVTFLRPLVKKNNHPAEKDITDKIMDNVPSITDSDLLQKIESGIPPVILDIRDAASFRTEHLKKSKNVTPDNLNNLLDKRTFFVILDDGQTGEAQQLVASLKKEDYSNIFYLEGGFSSWKNNGYPTISEGNPASIVDQSKVHYISSEELKDLIKKEKNIFLIDVRNSTSFSSGHLLNAANISLDQLEDNQNSLPLGKKLILYDDDGTLAFKGSVRLFDLGFFNVLSLSDGFNTWKQKGFEITL